ncbi:MAG TPA: hypothetical protein VFH54_00720 [Mycobacteriales bacterium]|nr:hypothetical protein [Mycobacteriales bacterium]
MESEQRSTANFVAAYRRQLLAEGLPHELVDRIVYHLATRLHDETVVHVPNE